MPRQGTLEIAGAAAAGVEIELIASMDAYSPTVATATMAVRLVVLDIVFPSFCETCRP
jgi:hypothetical protein